MKLSYEGKKGAGDRKDDVKGHQKHFKIRQEIAKKMGKGSLNKPKKESNEGNKMMEGGNENNRF